MVIDFHTHFVPSTFPERPAALQEAAWPSLRLSADGSEGALFTGDRKFRDFEAIYWDVERRVAVLNATGVDVQIMSPLPELLSYWLEPQAGAMLTDSINRAGADMARRSGGRLRAMGILPMQDVQAAMAQMAGFADLGLAGIFLGSHVNGISIASEQFHPVFGEAERLGLPLFVHGIRPAGLERIEGPGLMGAVIGIPYEGTMALAGFMATDILARFPRLHIVFAHGGGMIGSVIDRMELVWRKFPSVMQGALKEPPTSYARRFWYDSVVFSGENLSYLARRLGADRIVAGSDGPTEIGQTDLPGFVASAGLAEAEGQAILGGNAARLLEIIP
ncbi:amidohydrolase family protein [Sandaracinobacteroides sayramensis]|uniref:amidohydrolase family protein n=1 Tax=Sandaracinobacteroides sayramensis TaxID=2913411 RepID=UPI002106E608|nr:amidohydrolase family protein [Sandaracinobacteroides sayramensis]